MRELHYKYRKPLHSSMLHKCQGRIRPQVPLWDVLPITTRTAVETAYHHGYKASADHTRGSSILEQINIRMVSAPRESHKINAKRHPTVRQAPMLRVRGRILGLVVFHSRTFRDAQDGRNAGMATSSVGSIKTDLF